MPAPASRLQLWQRLRQHAIARGWTDPGFQAFRLLQGMLLVILVVGGFDKFTRAMINWADYVAPVLTQQLRLPTVLVLSVFGLAEILLGILIAIAPRIGGYAAMAYLWVWSLNALGSGDQSDAAFWTFGLSFACLALARLAQPTARRPIVSPG